MNYIREDLKLWVKAGYNLVQVILKVKISIFQEFVVMTPRLFYEKGPQNEILLFH